MVKRIQKSEKRVIRKMHLTKSNVPPSPRTAKAVS